MEIPLYALTCSLALCAIRLQTDSSVTLWDFVDFFVVKPPLFCIDKR